MDLTKQATAALAAQTPSRGRWPGISEGRKGVYSCPSEACGPAPRRVSAWWLGAGGVVGCAVPAVGGRRRRFGRGVGVSCHRHHVGGGRGRLAVFRHPVGVVSVSAAREVTVSRMFRRVPLLRLLMDRPGYRRVQ